jgi:hypothetical protein
MAMPLLIDPSSLRCPDFTQDIYMLARANLRNEQVDDAMAAATLAIMWTTINATDQAQYQLQVQEETVQIEACQQEADGALALRAIEEAKEKEEQKKDERRRNKAKYLPVPQRGIPTQSPVIPSAVATRKLDRGDYVPLWYFTNKGIEDASRSFSLVDDDVMVITKKADGTTSLIPASSAKEEKGLIEDQDLSWEEFTIASARMIDAMDKAEWPQDRISMMTAFWGGIQIHPFRSSSSALDRNTLLLYQAEQRKLWHQAIRTPGHGYSLAGINEQLLRETKERLYWIDRERKEKDKEAWVCVYISFQGIHVDEVLYLASLFYFIFRSHIRFYTPFFIAVLHCRFVFIADLSSLPICPHC